ncbi:AT-hook motif nuclear-localized protein 10 [Medicago truncatula]|uniref:AT-hook motif nuclear-localized protein n=1 Tax=Medicago truncatula TaxID=3880 RepID=G7IBH7_MEDTR|nr:AT-hook motif nuclear-localized protein 10 [Medicago truncatula]AES60011.2 AT hook motif protein [Medicago truncatula]
MDSHEPQQPHPHPHPDHLQLENVVLVDPNPFTNTVLTTMMEPITARFPQLHMNTNQPPHSEPLNNNIPSTLKPCVTASSGSGSIHKKKGRPRKYFPDGNIALVSSPALDATITSHSSSIANKSTRGRGRPRGSLNKKKKVEVSGVSGTGFSQHVITVNPGEDIVMKLKTFCQGGPNTDMCILSAHGLVGTVALHQSGTIVLREGRFEILSLSGMLEEFDNKNGFKTMGYFKVSLVDPNLNVLGGVVADKLIAASFVKVIVGSFTLDGKNCSSSNLKLGSSSMTISQFAAPRTPTSAAASQGPSSMSYGNNENIPFDQVLGIYNNDSEPIPTLSMYQQIDSPNSK